MTAALLQRFVDRSLSWRHIGGPRLAVLGAVLGLGKLYIFDYLGTLPPDSAFLRAHDACVVPCGSATCTRVVEAGRDSHYYPGKPHNGCAFTMWELTHLCFHVGIGFFFNVPISVTLSAGFELWEHFTHDCGSWLDLLWNGMGCVIGVLLAELLV